MAVIDGGKLIKESSQEGTIWYNGVLENGNKVDICSQGSEAGKAAVINGIAKNMQLTVQD